MKLGNGLDNLNPVFSTKNGAVPEIGLRPAVAEASNGEVLQPDQATVSATASQIAQASSISDVRHEKVASIQAALQAGTYAVPASAVAQKLVDALLAPQK